SVPTSSSCAEMERLGEGRRISAPERRTPRVRFSPPHPWLPPSLPLAPPPAELRKYPQRQSLMSGVRVLVGTRKGAFILTSDGKREKWEVSGPHFAGWEMYHLKGSPVDPNRIYASQSTGWFGQLIQRSNDGGKTWEPVGNKFE